MLSIFFSKTWFLSYYHNIHKSSIIIYYHILSIFRKMIPSTMTPRLTSWSFEESLQYQWSNGDISRVNSKFLGRGSTTTWPNLATIGTPEYRGWPPSSSDGIITIWSWLYSTIIYLSVNQSKGLKSPISKSS